MGKLTRCIGSHDYDAEPIGCRPVNVEETVRELAEIRTEPSQLWRRDPGLNLFAGICKNPQSGRQSHPFGGARPSPTRGDDTKVRKLSGSRSCGDAPALSNSSWNMIFKVSRRRRGLQSKEKLYFAIEIRQSSGRFSPWNYDQMPSAVSCSRSIGANSRSTP